MLFSISLDRKLHRQFDIHFMKTIQNRSNSY